MDVPDISGPVHYGVQGDFGYGLRVCFFKKDKGNGGGISRKHREVDPFSHDGGAQGKGFAGLVFPVTMHSLLSKLS